MKFNITHAEFKFKKPAKTKASSKNAENISCFYFEEDIWIHVKTKAGETAAIPFATIAKVIESSKIAAIFKQWAQENCKGGI